MQRLFRHPAKISCGGPPAPNTAQKSGGAPRLQHSAPARIQDEIYLFFLPPAFFFFATVGALLSIVVSQEPQFLTPRLPYIRHSLLFSSWEREEIFKNRR
jgi:hypothetical protein